MDNIFRKKMEGVKSKECGAKSTPYIRGNINVYYMKYFYQLNYAYEDNIVLAHIEYRELTITISTYDI
jgi:hypothetical protein